MADETIAERIYAAAYAALLTLAEESAPDAGDALLPAERITHNRDLPLDVSEPDGINLVDGVERKTGQLTGVDIWELTFTVEFSRRHAAADSAGVTGLPLRRLYVVALARLIADYTFGGLAIQSDHEGFTAGPVIGDQLGNLETGTAEFTVQYSTAENDPTRPGF